MKRADAMPYRVRGMGLVETMIGIVIGIIVVLAIYNIFAVAEGYKRTAVGVSDAQVTGQYAQFVLAREIGNAGDGMAVTNKELGTCNNDPRLKPIPVIIADGGTPDTPDSVITFYGNSTRIVHPILFMVPANPPFPVAPAFQVQSPNGFTVDDWVIASDRAASCFLAQVTSVSSPPGNGGEVNLTTTPAIAGFNDNWRLMNLGAMTRVQYTVDPAKLQLYSQNVNWQLPQPQPLVPIAQNVMLLKAQYGVDTNNDNAVDCWTPADNGNACGDGVDYSAATLVSAATTTATINRIKAVRIAVVVRSDEPDLKDPALVNQTAWLFNCSANTNAACQSRIQITNATLLDRNRYRIYETTIPLRNELWNKP